MTDNIIRFPGMTKLDIEKDLVLTAANDVEDLEEVVLLGQRKNGEYYFASTTGDSERVVFLCQKLINQLVSEE